MMWIALARDIDGDDKWDYIGSWLNHQQDEAIRYCDEFNRHSRNREPFEMFRGLRAFVTHLADIHLYDVRGLPEYLRGVTRQ